MNIQTQSKNIVVTDSSFKSLMIDSSKILPAIKAANVADGKVKELYLSALISACVLVLKDNNITLLNNCMNEISNNSIYKQLIVKWLVSGLNLKYNKDDKKLSFKKKGKKALIFSESDIQELADNPFWIKEESDRTHSVKDESYYSTKIVKAGKSLENIAVNPAAQGLGEEKLKRLAEIAAELQGMGIDTDSLA